MRLIYEFKWATGSAPRLAETAVRSYKDYEKDLFIYLPVHILSMKMFLSGHTVGAGNLFRQLIEL